MRLYMYRSGKKKDKARTSGINIERILMILFICSFGILIIVQAALMNPSVRTFLTVDGELEGTPLGLEEYLYKQGQIDLKLMNARISNNLKVLVNGDEVAAFIQNIVSLQIKNGDIIEIDGSKLKNEAIVQIVNKSDNIIMDNADMKMKISSNIKRLAPIKIK